MSWISSSMDHEAMEKGPCSEHGQDICDSLRYQMLSLKPSPPLSQRVLQSLAVIPAAPFDVPPLTGLASAASAPGVIFHPVFKFFFPFSNQVLRI
jgi:hypothetical protein